jgi:hypothetical protein
MVKTVVIPKKNKLIVEIPNNYIGKEIEVLLYAKEELEVKKSNTKKTLVDFNGIFSESEFQSLKSHSEKARSEWSRDI